MKTNQIYCGDNLKIMQGLPSRKIDLIYLDPPFFTEKVFKTDKGSFNDKWGRRANYLDFMKERLIECHRLLKDTGSIFLHCDYRANYKLRMLLDNVFGSNNFVNEIVWCYHGNASFTKKNFNKRYENILFYSKDKRRYTFNKQYLPYREDHIKRFKLKDKNGKRYFNNKNITNPKGYRVYMREGVALSNYWTDIQILTGQKERTGYPTQKPVALLDRIIKATTNPGDLVADFFCGSGTTIVSAQRLGRKWIACDCNPDAIKILKQRLRQVS